MLAINTWLTFGVRVQGKKTFFSPVDRHVHIRLIHRQKDRGMDKMSLGELIGDKNDGKGHD